MEKKINNCGNCPMSVYYLEAEKIYCQHPGHEDEERLIAANVGKDEQRGPILTEQDFIEFLEGDYVDSILTTSPSWCPLKQQPLTLIFEHEKSKTS